MAPPSDNRGVYALAVLTPVVLLFALQAAGLLPFQLDALHYLAFLLFLVAALQVQLGLVPEPAPKDATRTAPAPAPAAVTAPPTAPAIDVAADAADAAEEDEAEAAGAVVRHPALPSGTIPEDPRYHQVVKDMIAAFFAALRSAEDTSLWEPKVDGAALRVFMKKTAIPTFKVWSVVDNTPLTCFDFVSDALRRKSWDDMTDEARVVETIDQDTRIIYVRAKGIWPTAARDVLLLSHKTVLPDGKLLNVTKSVTHPDCPERTDGVIRMEVGIAGMLCYPSTVRPGSCEILQIGGGDPKGSIPKAIINLVTTKAVPMATEKLNGVLCKLAPLDPPGSAPAPRPRPRRAGTAAAAPDLTDVLGQLRAKLEQVERRVAEQQAAAARAAAAGTTLEQVRDVLDWATPFMLASIYTVGLYMLIRSRTAAAR